jgi:hypothetical protein
MVEWVAVSPDFDFVKQVNSATAPIGRNPDLDSPIAGYIVLVNCSCTYFYGILFWSVCDNPY